MLRSEHSIVTFDRGCAIPDRLTRTRHAHYLDYAERMLAAYRSGIGLPRRDLHRSIQNILAREPDCDPRRIASFCKLLDERAEFEANRKGGSAAMRLRVFTLAAKHHPLVSVPQRVFERPEEEVKRQIASELGLTWEHIERTLYADVISFQPLVTFEGYADARALLARYNVAQLQACLYRATRMSVQARSDFKMILRHAKLARLLHEIHRTRPGEYRIDLSGPASVLHETRRYGVSFARFVPALLTCADWQVRAMLPTPWGGVATLSLSSEDGYASHLAPPPEFDSSLEEEFARDFGPSEREGWRLDREGEVLHALQTTFLPDFVLRHVDGSCTWKLSASGRPSTWKRSGRRSVNSRDTRS
jgi:hypothetical protein